MSDKGQSLIIRQLGLRHYLPVWDAMRTLTDGRDADTLDECWFLQHHPVFTQGQAGREEHLLAPGDIPVIQADRGGQVTYHGPGQLVVYLMIDIQRRKLGPRQLVSLIEQSLVALLADYGVEAAPRDDAPGVYVASGEKIASLGLRIRKGASFHGLALNVDMDLEPFLRINPCGHANLAMTQLKAYVPGVTLAEVSAGLCQRLQHHIGYTAVQQSEGLPYE